MKITIEITSDIGDRTNGFCDICGVIILPSERTYTFKMEIPGEDEGHDFCTCTACRVKWNRAITFDPVVWDGLTG